MLKKNSHDNFFHLSDRESGRAFPWGIDSFFIRTKLDLVLSFLKFWLFLILKVSLKHFHSGTATFSEENTKTQFKKIFQNI